MSSMNQNTKLNKLKQKRLQLVRLTRQKGKSGFCALMVLSSKDIIIDLSVVAAVFRLDSAQKTWTSLDGGMSTMSIFHENSSGNVLYRLVATSKQQEVFLLLLSSIASAF